MRGNSAACPDVPQPLLGTTVERRGMLSNAKPIQGYRTRIAVSSPHVFVDNEWCGKEFDPGTDGLVREKIPEIIRHSRICCARPSLWVRRPSRTHFESGESSILVFARPLARIPNTITGPNAEDPVSRTRRKSRHAYMAVVQPICKAGMLPISRSRIVTASQSPAKLPCNGSILNSSCVKRALTGRLSNSTFLARIESGRRSGRDFFTLGANNGVKNSTRF